ncbi:Ger(x)C family spore germination protein [Desulfitobacterium metallireducens]|uniref:Germination protein Ger(X)C n=1 Tax=Desulfitobacterium metallireducens DSM 15288 TaxID=871968 RepID=W0E4N1_9FIRM|nr:Ger(x)C family spore germination protein [Desulfitobacterium metallireducens]AHF05810.1 germination protein Ger(x)C [Desulfitobacterium metallireducens DSM 15288]
MRKRVFIYILCLALTLSLTGCWNRKELTTLSVVQAIGIDKTEDGQINLTLQLLKPASIKASSGKNGKGASGSRKSVWVVTSTGQTLFDAIRNATHQVNRKSLFSQNKVIVIGEAAAKSGIAPLLDLVVRDPELRELSYIFIAKGAAKDIIEAENEQEQVPAKALENLVKATRTTSTAPEVTLLDLMKSIVSKTTAPILPGIELAEQPNGAVIEKQVQLCGTAVFKEDKLIGWFGGKETRGILWVLGKVKSGIIVVESPEDENKKVALEIISTSSKVTPNLIGGKLAVTVEVKEEGSLGEQMSQTNFTKPEAFKKLEEKQSAAIKDEITAALQKAQTWGVDIFKFGVEYHRKFPIDYLELKKNWEEEYKNIAVDIKVDAKLSRVGLTTTPVNAEEE